MAGHDCSKAFDDMGHSSEAKKIMVKFKIGELVEVPFSFCSIQNRFELVLKFEYFLYRCSKINEPIKITEIQTTMLRNPKTYKLMST